MKNRFFLFKKNVPGEFLNLKVSVASSFTIQFGNTQDFDPLLSLY